MDDPEYALRKAERLLQTLHIGRYRKRIFALDDFQGYIGKYKPLMYDDDVEFLFHGTSAMDGLIAWCGHISSKKKTKNNPHTTESLKDTSVQCLDLIYFLLNVDMGTSESEDDEDDEDNDNDHDDREREDDDDDEDEGDEKGKERGKEYKANVFRLVFLLLPVQELSRINFSLHLLTKPSELDFIHTCEILLLLLKEHRNVDDDELSHLDLELLVQDINARSIFEKWIGSVETIQMKGLGNNLQSEDDNRHGNHDDDNNNNEKGKDSMKATKFGIGLGSGGQGFHEFEQQSRTSFEIMFEERDGGGKDKKNGMYNNNEEDDLATGSTERKDGGTNENNNRDRDKKSKGGLLGFGLFEELGLGMSTKQSGKSITDIRKSYSRNRDYAKRAYEKYISKTKELASSLENSTSLNDNMKFHNLLSGQRGGNLSGYSTFLGKSTKLGDENFDPLYFLSEKCSSFTYHSLANAEKKLNKTLGDQANTLQILVCNHFDQFVSCADGIDDFRSQVLDDYFATERQGQGTGTGTGNSEVSNRKERLIAISNQTKKEARDLFHPLLIQQHSMSKLRNASIELHRLKNILDVPGRMVIYFQAGLYDEVAREYEKIQAINYYDNNNDGALCLSDVNSNSTDCSSSFTEKRKSQINNNYINKNSKKEEKTSTGNHTHINTHTGPNEGQYTAGVFTRVLRESEQVAQSLRKKIRDYIHTSTRFNFEEAQIASDLLLKLSEPGCPLLTCMMHQCKLLKKEIDFAVMRYHRDMSNFGFTDCVSLDMIGGGLANIIGGRLKLLSSETEAEREYRIDKQYKNFNNSISGKLTTTEEKIDKNYKDQKDQMCLKLAYAYYHGSGKVTYLNNTTTPNSKNKKSKDNDEDKEEEGDGKKSSEKDHEIDRDNGSSTFVQSQSFQSEVNRSDKANNIPLHQSQKRLNYNANVFSIKNNLFWNCMATLDRANNNNNNYNNKLDYRLENPNRYRDNKANNNKREYIAHDHYIYKQQHHNTAATNTNVSNYNPYNFYQEFGDEDLFLRKLAEDNGNLVSNSNDRRTSGNNGFRYNPADNNRRKRVHRESIDEENIILHRNSITILSESQQDGDRDRIYINDVFLSSIGSKDSGVEKKIQKKASVRLPQGVKVVRLELLEYLLTISISAVPFLIRVANLLVTSEDDDTWVQLLDSSKYTFLVEKKSLIFDSENNNNNSNNSSSYNTPISSTTPTTSPSKRRRRYDDEENIKVVAGETVLKIIDLLLSLFYEAIFGFNSFSKYNSKYKNGNNSGDSKFGTDPNSTNNIHFFSSTSTCNETFENTGLSLPLPLDGIYLKEALFAVRKFRDKILHLGLTIDRTAHRKRHSKNVENFQEKNDITNNCSSPFAFSNDKDMDISEPPQNNIINDNRLTYIYKVFGHQNLRLANVVFDKLDSLHENILNTYMLGLFENIMHQIPLLFVSENWKKVSSLSDQESPINVYLIEQMFYHNSNNKKKKNIGSWNSMKINDSVSIFASGKGIRMVPSKIIGTSLPWILQSIFLYLIQDIETSMIDAEVVKEVVEKKLNEAFTLLNNELKNQYNNKNKNNNSNNVDKYYSEKLLLLIANSICLLRYVLLPILSRLIIYFEMDELVILHLLKDTLDLHHHLVEEYIKVNMKYMDAVLEAGFALTQGKLDSLSQIMINNNHNNISDRDDDNNNKNINSKLNGNGKGIHLLKEKLKNAEKNILNDLYISQALEAMNRCRYEILDTLGDEEFVVTSNEMELLTSMYTNSKKPMLRKESSESSNSFVNDENDVSKAVQSFENENENDEGMSSNDMISYHDFIMQKISIHMHERTQQYAKRILDKVETETDFIQNNHQNQEENNNSNTNKNGGKRTALFSWGVSKPTITKSLVEYVFVYYRYFLGVKFLGTIPFESFIKESEKIESKDFFKFLFKSHCESHPFESTLASVLLEAVERDVNLNNYKLILMSLDALHIDN